MFRQPARPSFTAKAKKAEALTMSTQLLDRRYSVAVVTGSAENK
jgi:hypothetical protein